MKNIITATLVWVVPFLLSLQLTMMQAQSESGKLTPAESLVQHAAGLEVATQDPASGDIVAGGWAIDLHPNDTTAFLLKTKSDGSLLWQSAVGTEDSGGKIYQVILLQQDIFVAGEKNHQPWLARLNRAGAILWEHQWTTGTGKLRSLVLKNSLCYAAGEVEGKALLTSIQLTGDQSRVIFQDSVAGSFGELITQAQGDIVASGTRNGTFYLLRFRDETPFSTIEFGGGPADDLRYMLPIPTGNLAVAGVTQFMAGEAANVFFGLLDAQGRNLQESSFGEPGTEMLPLGMSLRSEQLIIPAWSAGQIHIHCVSLEGELLSVVPLGTVKPDAHPQSATLTTDGQLLVVGWQTRQGRTDAMLEVFPFPPTEPTQPDPLLCKGKWLSYNQEGEGRPLMFENKEGQHPTATIRSDQAQGLQVVLHNVPTTLSATLCTIDPDGSVSVNAIQSSATPQDLQEVLPARDSLMRWEQTGSHWAVLILCPAGEEPAYVERLRQKVGASLAFRPALPGQSFLGGNVLAMSIGQDGEGSLSSPQKSDLKMPWMLIWEVVVE